MKRLFFVAAIVVLLANCALAAPQSTKSEAITEISLERTACLGRCPMDKITLRVDGTVTYIGRGFVARLGRYQGRTADFSAIAALLETQEFFKLKENYSVPYTDADGAIIKAKRGGQQKMVTDYGYDGPVALRAIELALLGAGSRVQWQAATSGVRGVTTEPPMMTIAAGQVVPRPMPGFFKLDGGDIEYFPASVLTQQDGKFEISLPPGNYGVEFYAPSPDNPKLHLQRQLVQVQANKYADIVVPCGNSAGP